MSTRLGVVLIGGLLVAACGDDASSDVPATAEAGSEGEADPSASGPDDDESSPEPTDGSDGEDTEPADEDAPDPALIDAALVDPPGIESTPVEDVPSALDGSDDPSLPEPLVSPDDILAGGPPPDGIPAIDDPLFERVADVGWLADEEAVLALELGGEARAYPVQVMHWHELVNDTVGDVPVTVSYCPLCNSALAYDRRVGDRILDFGTSGRLYNSSLVMYDRQTESLWTHFDARAVMGVLTGTELVTYPVATVAWSDFRDSWPDGLVLSRATGFTRRYGDNPYVGYDDVGRSPFLFSGDIDERLPAMARVVVVRLDGEAVAIPQELLAEQRVVELDVAGRDLVAVLEPGVNSALETTSTATGRDVGATGVFERRFQDAELELEPGPDGFVDAATGTVFDIFGVAVDGPHEGQRLERVEHLDTFWFAIAAFEPDITVVTGEG